MSAPALLLVAAIVTAPAQYQCPQPSQFYVDVSGNYLNLVSMSHAETCRIAGTVAHCKGTGGNSLGEAFDIQLKVTPEAVSLWTDKPHPEICTRS